MLRSDKDTDSVPETNKLENNNVAPQNLSSQTTFPFIVPTNNTPNPIEPINPDTTHIHPSLEETALLTSPAEALSLGVYKPKEGDVLVSKSGVNLDITKEYIINSSILPSTFGFFTVTSSSQIGKRKNQEDRMLIAPALMGGELACFAIFDGTVREHAADWVHRNYLRVFYESPRFRKFADMTAEERADRKYQFPFAEAIEESFYMTDAELLEYCAKNDYPYTSCTAVVCFIHIPAQSMYISYLGDSHAIIGLDQNKDKLVAQCVTSPHRPDLEQERRRIEKAGGSVVYLHGNRPFIRGGDFHRRQLSMQLNYSRAFGGKDLKNYGLSCVPDIRIINLKFPSPKNPILPHLPTPHTSLDGLGIPVVILGSDGLWDVLGAQEAVDAALETIDLYGYSMQRLSRISKFKRRPQSPSEFLVQAALENHIEVGSSDNVSCIVVYF